MHARRLSLALIALLAACEAAPVAPGDAGPPPRDAGPRHEPRPFAPTDATRAYCPGDDDAIEARITEILRELSLAEKVSMMHGVGIALVDGTWGVAGNERLGVPGLHMLDGPRGLSRISGKTGTAFPVAMLRGATFDPELERRVGAAMAIELRSAGADVLLAPTINVLRHPRWGRAQETYSEDVHHMGEMAVAFIEGAQAEGVLASAKHFAANSIEDTRHEVDVTIDERTLREIYLPHFERAVREARVASVMSAYNQVNGLYCDLSTHLLRDILRDEWGFAGFVESDWIFGTHGDGESVRAGLDIEMPTGSRFRAGIPQAIAEGEITEHDVDEAVRRVLRAQLCYGLDARARVLDDASMRETPAHLELAREVATRGIVLLRNERPDGAPADAPLALPLDRATDLSLIVMGRAADVANIGDEGSSSVRPSESTLVTALVGIRQRAGVATAVQHVPGTTIDAALEPVIRAAHAVIVVTGLLADDEGESDIAAGDRDSLALRSDEVALIRRLAGLHPRVVVVLEGGAAITAADWVDDVEALLFAFYPGAQGGRALADVLYGDVAPSGRLPFSIPRLESDLPEFDNVSTSVTYGYFHGYRHLERESTPALYPFGHGLSYTTFDYVPMLALDRPTLRAGETLEVTATITNSGARAAIETVQLYVSAIGSRVERAPQDLRAFAQVTLSPGASAPVTLRVRADDLRYYDVATSAWILEPIEYEVRVGRSSGDLRAVGRVRVE